MMPSVTLCLWNFWLNIFKVVHRGGFYNTELSNDPLLLHVLLFFPHDHQFHNAIDKKICVIWRCVSKSTYVFNAINILRQMFLVFLQVSYRSERKPKATYGINNFPVDNSRYLAIFFSIPLALLYRETQWNTLKEKPSACFLFFITKYQSSCFIWIFKLQALLAFLPFALVGEIILH